MNIYVVSDTHFGHQFMYQLGYRPDDYEKRFWDSWNRLNEDDIVLHLGDLGYKLQTSVGQMVHQMPGKKLLIRGNHDGGYLKYYKMGFDMVLDQATLQYNGLTMLFSHKPIKDHNADVNIHGHLHGNDHRIEDGLEWYIQHNGKYIDIAPEVFGYQLLSLKSVIKQWKNESQ